MKQRRDASIALLDLNVLEASPDEDHASCVKNWMEKLNRACGIIIFFSRELDWCQSLLPPVDKSPIKSMSAFCASLNRGE